MCSKQASATWRGTPVSAHHTLKVLRIPYGTEPTRFSRKSLLIVESEIGSPRREGNTRWKTQLSKYHKRIGSLKKRWSREREQERIPVMLPDSKTLTLSPGKHSALLKRIIADFCARWTPGARVLYVGDTQHKFALFDREVLERLGVSIDLHGKMPDLVVYAAEHDWLILIEAVTSHGPVDEKRHEELQEMFGGSSASLLFVTAFLDRQTMARHVASIAWETEVWVADSPSHLVHFDGEHFLSPDIAPN